MWPLSSHGLEKALPQVVQTHGSVCERMCIFKAPRLLYSFGQCLHRKAALVVALSAMLEFSTRLALVPALQCESWWRESAARLLQEIPQWAHWKRSEGSGLGGSEVLPSSSSPELDGELRSSGAIEDVVVGDEGGKGSGRALVVQTSAAEVYVVTSEPSSLVGSSASG